MAAIYISLKSAERLGDYEGLSFIEAIREFSQCFGRANCLFVHVVYVPFIETSKEFKSKPAQNALNDLRGFGIVPDAVVVRSDKPAPKVIAEKISLFSGVPIENVLMMPNSDTVYRVPTLLAKSSFRKLLTDFSGLKKAPNLAKWNKIVNQQILKPKKSVTIGLVAKYIDNEDTYMSVIEALKAAAWHEKVGLDIRWIGAETATKKDFQKVDGIVVPGGFGTRGIEGKIAAARYALDNNVPYLGFAWDCRLRLSLQLEKPGSKTAIVPNLIQNANKTSYILWKAKPVKNQPEELYALGIIRQNLCVGHWRQKPMENLILLNVIVIDTK
jgi:CTP synthase